MTDTPDRDPLLAQLRADPERPTPDPDTTLARLLALGVPYALAVEAIASTALDRDETVGTRHLTPEDQRVVADELEALGYQVTEPAWLQEDPDGFRIVDRD